MNVLFTTTGKNNKDVSIDYVISTLEYDFRSKQVMENQSFFLTNNSNTSQSIRMIHRRNIQDVKPLEPRNNSDYKFIDTLYKATDRRFLYDKDSKLVNFFPKAFEIREEPDKLRDIRHLDNLGYELEPTLQDEILNRETAPFTSVKIDGFPAKKTVFYSLNMVVKEASFEDLVANVRVPNIAVGNTLLGKIQSEDLANYPNDSQWHNFYKKNIKNPSKIIIPEEHDIFISDKYGSLPDFFRLNNVYCSVIENRSLAKKFVKFNTGGDRQDFELRLFFKEKENLLKKILSKH